jgi:hypothetical protein
MTPSSSSAAAAAEHFRLHVLATVAHLVQEAAHSYDSLEALTVEIPFLRDYLEELEGGPDQLDLPRWREAIARLEEATPAHLPLRALREACGLDRIALGVLVTTGLIEEDARFGLLFEPFQRGSGAPRPTAGLLNAWWRLPDDRGEVRGAIRRLRELGLVEVVNPDAPRLDWALQVHGFVWDALRGETAAQPIPGVTFRPHDALAGIGALILPDAVATVFPRLAALLRDRGGPALIVRGATHAGRGTLALALAESLGLGVVEVAAQVKLDDVRWSQLGAVATMLDALLLVRAEAAAGEQLELRRSAALARPLAVIAQPSIGVTVSGGAGAFTVELPLPDLAERAAHWSRAAPASQAAAPLLAERFRIGRGQIHRAAAIARARAELDGRPELCLEDARVAVRSLGASSLETLAPRVLGGERWDRFVVAPDTLEELRVLERRCRHRERLKTPGARAEAGVRALFKGPSGTGKTMAARVLAAALEKDLYRVDLAAAVSKYIGETEKNLGRIFALGEELDAMLLFDEGDALFGARTAVQSSNDRYANLETNYLLQRIETFDGILIITTNAADAIDGAFQRRLDVVVDFRPPEDSERWLLWQVHLPAEHAVPPSLLRELAARCTLTGAQVRNVMLHAQLLAIDDDRPFDGAHVEAAVLREYRKMGAICPLRRTAAAAGVRS